MKRTPDKIYLATTEEVQNLDNTFVDIAHSNPEDIIEPIEYIRKDTFVKKACEFLKSYRQDTPDGFGYIAGIVNDKTIEAFKNYMKGE